MLTSQSRYLEYLKALYLLRAVPELIELCKDALNHYPGDTDLLEELEDGEDAYSTRTAQVKDDLRASGTTLDEYSWGMLPIKTYP